jgi:hypothetical protein
VTKTFRFAKTLPQEMAVFRGKVFAITRPLCDQRPEPRHDRHHRSQRTLSCNDGVTPDRRAAKHLDQKQG